MLPNCGSIAIGSRSGHRAGSLERLEADGQSTAEVRARAV
jgi:hypothetical protein